MLLTLSAGRGVSQPDRVGQLEARLAELVGLGEAALTDVVRGRNRVASVVSHMPATARALSPAVGALDRARQALEKLNP